MICDLRSEGINYFCHGTLRILRTPNPAFFNTLPSGRDPPRLQQLIVQVAPAGFDTCNPIRQSALLACNRHLGTPPYANSSIH